MFLLAFEDRGEEIAADIVADLLAMLDRVAQQGDGLHLELEIGLEHFLDRLADAQAPEQLEIGQALEKQDALGELVGMLHLVDRFVDARARRAWRRPNCRAAGSAANIG